MGELLRLAPKTRNPRPTIARRARDDTDSVSSRPDATNWSGSTAVIPAATSPPSFPRGAKLRSNKRVPFRS